MLVPNTRRVMIIMLHQNTDYLLDKPYRLQRGGSAYAALRID